MAQLKLMHAKLHRVTVTEVKPDYMGSLTLDPGFMAQVGLLPLEEVTVVNVSNGNRWCTYALPGTPGSRQVCSNGGAAWLCQVGDILIVWAHEFRERIDVLKEGHTARVAIFGESNQCVQVLNQALVTARGQVLFQTTPVNDEDSVLV